MPLYGIYLLLAGRCRQRVQIMLDAKVGVTIARGRYSLCCFPVSVNRGVVKVFR